MASLTDVEDLHQVIRMNLHGVRPEDQEIELTDDDWLLILRGLSALADTLRADAWITRDSGTPWP